MNINSIELLGKVTELRGCVDPSNSSCNHQYFTLEFKGALCTDYIEVCDWSNANVRDDDIVIVKGLLQSNQKNIDDGYIKNKKWFIMVYGTGNETGVLKVSQ